MLESSIGGFFISIVFEEQCNFPRLLPVDICLTKPICSVCLPCLFFIVTVGFSHLAGFLFYRSSGPCYLLGIVFLTALILFV